MTKQPQEDTSRPDMDGYFKVFLGTTNFHLLMKDLIRQQMCPLDLVLMLSKAEGDWTRLCLETRFRNSFLKKAALRRYIQQNLERLISVNNAGERPIALFYPNDDNFDYQFAISYFKKSAKRLLLVMYEDGLGSLRTREEHRETRPFKLAKKHFYRFIFSGDYFNTAGFRGSLADHYVGLSKDSFHEERVLHSRPLTVLDMKRLSSLMQGVQGAYLGKKTHIFLSEVLVEAKTIPTKVWFEYIDAAAASIARLTDELHVKPHPRENGDKFEETVDSFRRHIKRVEVMGQRVSIEEYANSVRDRHNLVLHGCRTGGLYYVKLLYPEIEIVMHQERLIGASAELDSNIRFHRKLMKSAGCKQ